MTVTVKDGKRTVSTRRLRLSKRCTYSVDVRYSRNYGSLRFSARYGGNSVFLSRSSPGRTVRTRLSSSQQQGLGERDLRDLAEVDRLVGGVDAGEV